MYSHFTNCIYKDFYSHLNKDALEQFKKKYMCVCVCVYRNMYIPFPVGC